MTLWSLIVEGFLDFVLALFPVKPFQNGIPAPQRTQTATSTIPATAPVPIPQGPNPAQQLCDTARKYLGQDVTPDDSVPDVVACATTVVHIVNETWPVGVLQPYIVGTDALYQALYHSKRFKPVLDPQPGTIVVSPQTPTTHGHCGIYVGPDEIASNDSSNGKFNINYNRQSWRNTFIKGRGLKGYLFTPV